VLWRKQEREEREEGVGLKRFKTLGIIVYSL